MVAKPINTQFNQDWQKALAFAQLHGLTKDQVAPVYQYDQQRVANGSYPLSQPERTRALLAAKNPNNVTPVPSDKPNPKSFLGNARTDLANIFTGLAPNHLVPQLFHTAENAIAHPQSWIKPAEEIGKGALSGNLGEVKKGLEQAAGPGNILSLVPGVSVLGELAQGGVDAVLAHPISSFLDVAPFAPAGRLLSVAAGDIRTADIASKLGMSVEQFNRSSIPGLAASWVLSRPLTKIAGEGADAEIVNAFPGAGLLTKGIMRDAQGNPLTVSGLLAHWSQTTGGITKPAAAIGAAALKASTYGTDAHIFTMVPYARAVKNLGADGEKQVQDLVMGPRDHQDVMGDESIDPTVRDAFDKGRDVLDMLNSQSLASGDIIAIRGPQGATEMYTADRQHAGVTRAAYDRRDELLKTVKVMGPANDMHRAMTAMDKQEEQMVGQLEHLRQQGLQADIAGFTSPVPTQFTRKGDPKAGVSLSLPRQRDLLLGDHGLIGQISEKLSNFTEGDGTFHNTDPATALALTRAAIGDLEKNGVGRIEHTVDPTLGALHVHLLGMRDHLEERVALEHRFTKQLVGMSKAKGWREATLPTTKAERSKIADQLKSLATAEREFTKAWWNQPSDAWRSVAYDAWIDKQVHDMGQHERVGEMSSQLADMGLSRRQIDAMTSDPTKMAEAIWHQSRIATVDPIGPRILDDKDQEAIWQSGVHNVNALRAEGLVARWIPVVTSRDIERYDPSRYGVGLTRSVRDLSSTKARNMREMMPERYDLLAALDKGTREAVARNNTIEFTVEQLAPHMMTSGDVYQWAYQAFPDEYARRDPSLRSEADLREEHISRLGLVEWDPTTGQHLGFTLPRWANTKTYLPKGIAGALDKLLDKGEFPMDGVYDKATNVFRTSILGLSPRFTAHITFGGMMMLALRSDPRIVTKFAQAYKMAKNPTHLPVELRQVSAERGVQPLEYRTVALEQASKAGGAQMAHMVVQEAMAKKGIDWRNAGPLAWAKGLAEVNFSFTNRVSTMYRAAAMLDYAAKAEKRGHFEDPVTGEKVAMTRERAEAEGIHHALKIMGDLRSMSPLERTTFMRVMPFYGWTRHILQYVTTYPVDHPYRAQVLSVLADQDADSMGKALDKRLLFMFFLGSPDSSGNVKGVDVRFLDPFRDVSNYATIGGWIGALNPALTAPLAAIDPNLVFGTTSLYPNVTYNEFYGIETSATQGNALLSAGKQFVTQIGALDSAMSLAGNYRSLATKNPNAFYKTIFESLNIPFAQVQNLNTKQLAVKGELARYRVAQTAASDAWKQQGMGGSGIEQALAGYSSVPSPLNPDYEITPTQLQQIYNLALAQYPGQNPSDVLASPPNPSPAYTP